MDSKTTDGVAVVPGLRVFTIDCRWGTVEKFSHEEPSGAWWTVIEDGRPGSVLLNGDRMRTRDMIGFSIDPVAEQQRKDRINGT